MPDARSGCPINLSLEVIGDRWSLIIVRDIMFGDRRTYRELLTNSLEGIASNILASRLRMLMAEGMLTRAAVPGHRQKAAYSLTEKSIALVPLFAQLGGWARRFLPVTPELEVRARLLEEGGPPLWDAFMAELRTEHLGAPPVAEGPSVRERFHAEYERLVRAQQDAAAGDEPRSKRGGDG